MPVNVRQVIVLGAGAMGTGIAQSVATGGRHQVYLMDVEQSVLEKALDHIGRSLDKFVAKGALDDAQRRAILNRIKPVREFEIVAQADLVIEAVPEDLDLKREIFGSLSTLCPEVAILATNTSSLPITSLAEATKRPDKVIGMHFMNPVPLMKGVEIIPGRMTSPETLQTAVDFVEGLGKTACVAVDYAGFINSRLLNLYINEAVLAVMDGNPPEEVDKVMVHTANMPLGPLRLLDLVGLDVHLHVMDILRTEFGDRFRAAPLTRQMVRAGHLGRKTGRGFYEY